MSVLSLNPDNTEFVVFSFEGPDPYALAGGLGVRIANLSETLAAQGFRTHLFFIGCPTLKGEETLGNLTLHRWCQWISRHYQHGVYHGEYEKLEDFNRSLPAWAVKNVILPAQDDGKIVVVLGEEWHTAEAMVLTSDLLHDLGRRNRAIMLWNANNTFSFDRINWQRLSTATVLTTVSRYMKQIMRGMGLETVVIPNGIPRGLLDELDPARVHALRSGLGCDIVLSKVARWDPSKRWLQAVEAVARLKDSGLRTVLLARGGMESHQVEVMQLASSLGLKVNNAWTEATTTEGYCRTVIEAAAGADVVNINFHCPHDFLRVVYSASDAVLANSGHEPFGLVGLEAMAAGGIAFTGGTGEDYAIPYHNSIVLESADPAEIETYIHHLRQHPGQGAYIRRQGRHTAAHFTWEKIVDLLLMQLEYRATLQGLTESHEVSSGVGEASDSRQVAVCAASTMS